MFEFKGIKNLTNYVIPFCNKYVVPYSSKYNIIIFSEFISILNKLENKSSLNKEEFIELIRIIYEWNKGGKGKQRKRTLNEVINVIRSKSSETKS